MIGGDAQLAAAIVVRAVETSFDMSNEGDSHVAIRSWLRQYGNEAVYSDPETMLQLLLVLAMSGGQDVTGWLTEVERALPMPTRSCVPSCTGCGPSRTWPKDPLITLCPTTRWLSSGREDVRRHPILEALPAQLVDISLIEGDLVAASDAMERSSVAPLHPLVGDLLLSGARAWLAFLRGELVLALREADLVDQRADELSAPFHAIGRILVDMVHAGLALEHGELTVARDAWPRRARCSTERAETARVLRLVVAGPPCHRTRRPRRSIGLSYRSSTPVSRSVSGGARQHGARAGPPHRGVRARRA